MASFIILFPSTQFLPTGKYFKFQPWTIFIWLVFLPLSEFKAWEQVSLPFTSTTFPELNDHLISYLSIEIPLRQNSIRLFCLICSELFNKSCSLCLLWENSPISPPPAPPKKTVKKVVTLKYQNYLKWNPTIIVSNGITEIIF